MTLPNNNHKVKPKTLDDFLMLFKGVKPGKDGWYEAICPAHIGSNGERRSLGIREDNGVIGLNCFAKCTGESIMSAIGLELKDLYLNKKESQPRKKISKIYVYPDLEVVRTEPKGFYQRRPDGKGGYYKDEKGKYTISGAKLTLYHPDRLPQAIADNKPIFFVEGEKDVESLEAIGLIATTNPMGAGKFHSYYSESLRNADLIIIPDDDKPDKQGKRTGENHAADVARLCFGKAARIRVLRLQGAHDSTDWLNLGHTAAELLQLADQCPDYEPEPEPVDHPDNENVNPLDDTLHDVGNAKRLINQFGHKIRYNYERNLWLINNGKYWEWDEGGKVTQLAKITVRNIYHEAGDTEDADKQDKLVKHAKASQSNVRIKAMIEQARDEVAVKVADLNADHYQLNVNNGTIDLHSGELKPHNPDDLITYFIPIDYIPGQQGKKWLTFLNRIFENNQDLISYVQKSLGYSITGDQQELALWFNKGAGWNGKSTLYGVVGDVLADYAGEIDPLAFMVVRNDKPGPNEALASLYNKRFVTSVEIKTAMKLNVALVKRMTGGEKLRCERKFEHGFDFKPTHKLWLLGNAEPRIDDDTNSIWFRLKYIPFNVTIPEGERDKTLRPTLLKDEGGAILAWLVEGCLKWQKEGLGEPDEVKEAVATYRASQDILHDYKEENFVVGSTETAKVKDTYSNYLDWAKDNNFEPLGKIKFNGRLKDMGFINKPGNKNEQEWHGFRLKTPLEKVNSVISVNEIPESPQEKSRVLGTFGKSGNKNNTFNTSNPAEPPTELPDCRCGANEWVMQPDGSLYCPKCFNTTEVNQ